MAGINLRQWLTESSPTWLLGHWGSRFVGGAIGTMADLLGEGAAIAMKAPWVRQRKSPPDALPLLGNERSMPRYDADTDLSYRKRLFRAWSTWSFAGTVEGIGSQGVNGQLAAAGYENITILNNFHWDFESPKGTIWWSRFVVIIEQPHPFERWTYGSGPVYGGAVTYGCTASIEQIREIKGIIRKWRDGHSVNPWIYVIIDHEYYGDPDIEYGAAGAVYGADTLRWPHFATIPYGAGHVYGLGSVYGQGWI